MPPCQNIWQQLSLPIPIFLVVKRKEFAWDCPAPLRNLATLNSWVLPYPETMIGRRSTCSFLVKFCTDLPSQWTIKETSVMNSSLNFFLQSGHVASCALDEWNIDLCLVPQHFEVSVGTNCFSVINSWSIKRSLWFWGRSDHVLGSSFCLLLFGSSNTLPISSRMDIAFATKTLDLGLISGQVKPKDYKTWYSQLPC